MIKKLKLLPKKYKYPALLLAAIFLLKPNNKESIHNHDTVQPTIESKRKLLAHRMKNIIKKELSINQNLEQELSKGGIPELVKLIDQQKISSIDFCYFLLQKCVQMDYENSHKIISEINFSGIQQLEENDNQTIQNGLKTQRLNKGARIPFIVEDIFNIRSLDSSYGLSSLIFQPQTNDSDIVKLFIDQGFIPILKSKSTAFGLLYNYNNQLNIETNEGSNSEKNQENSLNIQKSFVKTQSFEFENLNNNMTKLMANINIPFGICSDVMGSSKIQVYLGKLNSFMPGRIIMKKFQGFHKFLSSDHANLAQINFISKEIENFDSILDSLQNNSQNSKDFSSNNQNQNRFELKQLTIGYIKSVDTSDSDVSQIGFNTVIENLQKEGHNLIEVKINEYDQLKISHQKLQEVILNQKIVTQTLKENYVKFSCGKKRELVQEYYREESKPILSRILYFIRLIISFKKQKKLAQANIENTLHTHIDAIAQRFMKEVWQKQNIDFIITPSILDYKSLQENIELNRLSDSFSLLINQLGLPSCILSLGLSRNSTNSVSIENQLNHQKLIAKTQDGNAEQKQSGLVNSIQVIGNHQSENNCLKFMKYLSTMAQQFN